MKAEELYIKNIESGIRAIRMGSKEPNDTRAPVSLNKLKEVNVGLYEDYLAKYKRVLVDYSNRNQNNSK
jgi:hypothetical protein